MADSEVRRIGLLAPMVSEFEPLSRHLGLREHQTEPHVVHVGNHGDIDLVATRTDIGTEAARRATERLLDDFDIDHVFVVGIAGGVDPGLAIGELIEPEVVIDGPSGREFRPTYLTSLTPRGSLVTSDELLHEPDRLQALVEAGVVAVDMETAAIAAVCEQRGTPWSVFRAISDRADDVVFDDHVMDLVNPDGTPKRGPAVKFVVTRPWRLPHMMRVFRGSLAAADEAARAAADACRRL
jgi:adenosylhomocysteine nucleosidase